MSVYYFETSAFLKRYRTEKGTDVIEELFEGKGPSEVFTTSYFTVLESASVATRLVRTKSITNRSYQQLMGDMARDLWRLFILQAISEAALSEALDLVTSYALRAPDAVQLATALGIQSTLPDEPFYFICTDKKLKAACTDKGLTLLDPEARDSLMIMKSYRSNS